jgi:hypothetical protein
MNSLLDSVFLRLYGFNLGRRFRNSPPEACGDALLQIVLLLALPAWLLLSSLISWLQADGLATGVGNLSYILCAALGLPPLILWLIRRFNHYKMTPEAASPFRAPRQRWKSALIFTLVPLLLLVAVDQAGCARHVFTS